MDEAPAIMFQRTLRISEGFAHALRTLGTLRSKRLLTFQSTKSNNQRNSRVGSGSHSPASARVSSAWCRASNGAI